MVYISLLFLAAAQIVLAIIINYKRHSKVSRMFFYFTLVLSFWTVANATLAYALGATQFTSLQNRLTLLNWSNRIGYASGTLTLLMLYNLLLTFPAELKDVRSKKYVTMLGALLALGSLHSVVSGSYTLTLINGVPKYNYGLLTNLVTVFYLFIAGLALQALVSTLRSNRSTLVKQQAKTVLASLMITSTLAILIIVVIPFITGDDSFIVLGYFTPFVFTIGVFYSIFKHGFLNFQSLVARSVGYILSIGVLVVTFTILSVVIVQVLLDVRISRAEEIIFAILCSVAALTYPWLKSLFAKATNRIFYNNIYNTQEVLDDIGKIIVGSIDLRKIQQSSLDILNSALKTTYLGFVLTNRGSATDEIFIGQHPQFDKDDLNKILKNVGSSGLLYDELDEKATEKKHYLHSNDISLVIPLITKNEKIGYIITGPKKSGNIITQQDRDLLSVVANELAVALQNAQRFEEIQAFNLTLQEKVNEATRELKSTNKKLIELDEAKDEFISMASHQLRTPLTSIKGYLSMILDGDMGKLTKNQTNALKEAFGSSQRMVFLISDFLNVSRIKTGKFVIETSEVNLAKMVHEELVQLKELAESRNVEFKYDQPDEFPIVKLDDNKIRQVMMNMIDNAIYYTPVGGTVNVQLYVDGNDVVFKVIDTGIGVPKAEQHKLFTKFFRAGNARVARPDGTGLGLFMAQKIILAQGGSIIFESEEGKGSTFGWRFPLKKIKA